MSILTEGLNWHDLEGQLLPIVSVDEFAAHMGADDEIITLAFYIKSQTAGNDLTDWFERGYDWVLDAALSDGEISPGKYLVFVEISRRTTAPDKLIELIDDLTTLSNIPVQDWVIRINDEDYSPEADVLKQVMILSPHAYRESAKEVEIESDTSLNEMRKAAGIEVKKLYANRDDALKSFMALAGL